MSHNQNHDHHNVRIRLRFFVFLKLAKWYFLHFMRLLLSSDVHLNLGPFSHFYESDMLIDIYQCTQFRKQIWLFHCLKLLFWVFESKT